MKKVYFTQICRTSPRLIKFKCTDEIDGIINNYDFYYEFSEDNTPSDNALAVSFSCLLGKKQYDEIYIDLDINLNILETIREFNNCNVNCKNIINTFNVPKKKNKVIINFSGGLDSLSLINLFKHSNTSIISLDFGGKFTRESIFFKDFNPIILKTNLRESEFFKKLESKSWQFMGIGTILYAEKLESKYYSFGTILEADRNFNCHVSPDVLPFSALGLKYVSAINGLTEVSTTKIACYYHRNLIHNSLQSLADPGTVKRLRKDLLASIFINDITINKINNFKFGRDYTFDFLLFYFIKFFGYEFMKGIINEIPEQIHAISSTFKLTFYERVNPKAFITFDNYTFYNNYLRKLFEAGITLYDENDYYELYKIRDILSKYYNEENRHLLLSSCLQSQ